MKISIRLAVCISFMAGWAGAAPTPFQWRDGKIFFAKYLVGNKPAFSDSERDDYAARDKNAAVVVVVPTDYEAALIASGIKFSVSEFQACSVSTEAVQNKIGDPESPEAKAKAAQIQVIKNAMAAALSK